jgi:hypothetical protein
LVDRRADWVVVVPVASVAVLVVPVVLVLVVPVVVPVQVVPVLLPGSPGPVHADAPPPASDATDASTATVVRWILIVREPPWLDALKTRLLARASRPTA